MSKHDNAPHVVKEHIREDPSQRVVREKVENYCS